MIAMYTRCTQVAVIDNIISEFVKGMKKSLLLLQPSPSEWELTVPIACVVRRGPSDTVEDYVKEIYQAGRTNQPACALLFFAPGDKDMWAKIIMVEYSTIYVCCVSGCSCLVGWTHLNQIFMWNQTANVVLFVENIACKCGQRTL